MHRDLVLWERLCEDVHGHVLRRAIIDLDVVVVYSLSYVVVVNSDVFGPRVIIVVCCKVERQPMILSDFNHSWENQL